MSENKLHLLIHACVAKLIWIFLLNTFINLINKTSPIKTLNSALFLVTIKTPSVISKDSDLI